MGGGGGPSKINSYKLHSKKLCIVGNLRHNLKKILKNYSECRKK